MRVVRHEQAPVRRRDGLVSHLLLDAGDLGARSLAVTWVRVAPGAGQPPHRHDTSEQAYVVVAGHGVVTVDGETTELAPGDLVLIPPAAEHAIRNASDDELVYVSATAPPTSIAALYPESGG